MPLGFNQGYFCILKGYIVFDMQSNIGESNLTHITVCYITDYNQS